MSQSVLFDAPGPKTIRRHRLYTVLTVLVLAGIAALAVYRLADRGQFEADTKGSRLGRLPSVTRES